MKTAIIVILILTATILLTGCGHYGRGMGGHHYYSDQNTPTPGSQNLNGNSMQTQGPWYKQLETFDLPEPH